MSDIVVTLPIRFGLERWITEGDPAGEPWSGTEWGFSIGGARPDIQPGERVYIIYDRRLRGYAPLTRIVRNGTRWVLCRGGDAVAVTIPEEVLGFRGWRRRWWDHAIEVPFPDWMRPQARGDSPGLVVPVWRQRKRA